MKKTSIFGILSFTVITALASRKALMFPEAGTWITMENFTTMISKSFVFSKCCNIYLSGWYTCDWVTDSARSQVPIRSSISMRSQRKILESLSSKRITERAFISDPIHDLDMLLRLFINSYPYEYLLNKKTYACRGYFLLASTDKETVRAMRKVPSSISTTEILIIINDELGNNSQLFDVSLYGNSNANIVSKSGIWTLSENYLKPRVFMKVDSYEDLMYEFDMINLKGRELQVSTFYRPPVSYLNRTVRKIINGEEEEVYAADNDIEKDGIEVKIFLLLAEKLNFTWTIRKPKGEYKYGRRVNDTLWNGGMIQLLNEKKIDIAFANIWIMHNHYKFVNMSQAWYQLSIQFLVPRPRPITNFWALTRPFSLIVWLLLLIMLFANSIYLFVRARIDPKFPKRFRSFFSTITELMGRLLGIWVPRNIAHARFELHLWQVVGLVLVTAYSSSLAARLANWEYEKRIDTMLQFLQANLSWGRKGKVIPVFSDYFDMDDPYASQIPSRFIFVKDDEDTHRFIATGKYAIIGKSIDSIFFAEDEILNEDLKHYRVMKQSMARYYASFAVQPWLVQPVNTIILWLTESGITHHHLMDVLRRKANFNLLSVLKEDDGVNRNAKVLGLTPLGAGFMVLVAGLFVSTMMFVCELKQAANSRSIRELLRDIRRKRESKRACERET